MIKENPDFAKIPVYMLSGLEDKSIVTVCKDRGAEGVIAKPMTKLMLVEILKKHNLGSLTDADFSVAIDEEIQKESRIGVKSPAITKLLKKTDDANDVSVVVPIGQVAPAFKLCSSEFIDFVYPSLSYKKNILFAFIPTIFCPALYTEHGFLQGLYKLDEPLRKKGVTPIVVSNDLPHALSAGQYRFKLPFMLLADPTLACSRRYIGTFDAGSLIAAGKGPIRVNDMKNALNSHIAPFIGFVLVDRERIVHERWIGVKSNGELEVKFPDLGSWINKMNAALAIMEAEMKSKRIEEEVVVKIEEPSADEVTSIAETKVDESVTDEPAPKKSVLVVDDSSVSSRVVTRKLEAIGFLVQSAPNGQIAFDLLMKDPTHFSIVLADVMMPVCDGYEFLTLVNNELALKHLIVIMVSGLQATDVHNKCLGAGAVGLMKKPFDAEKFLEILNSQTKKSSQGNDSQIDENEELEGTDDGTGTVSSSHR